MKRPGAFLGGDLLLLFTAIIWGFAFVAQRVGMDYIGPFAFNAVRYLIGALSLVPLLFFPSVRSAAEAAHLDRPSRRGRALAFFGPPLAAGAAMFLGSSFQQVGLVTTTAGNAAFITSLYVVLVPLLGRLFGKRFSGIDIAAALVAVGGLWLITIRGGFSISSGDLFVLVCAFFWALHILVIGRFANHYDPIRLAIGQFTVSGALSLAISLATERTSLAGLRGALVPLLYGGLASCGVAFTLQIFGQKKAKASHASIIMALEGLFGAIGGILILGEPATARILAGGGLMILATILPRLPFLGGKAEADPASAGEKDYRTGFASWNSSAFDAALPLSELEISGIRRTGIRLILDPASAERLADPAAGADADSPPLLRAVVESPEIAAGFPALEAIPSWNSLTPAGTWVEVSLAARIGGRWTRYFDHGRWTATRGTLEASSAAGEEDEDGKVATDTLRLNAPAEAFKLRVVLCAKEGAQVPELRGLALAWSSARPEMAPPTSEALLRDLLVPGVPAWSQRNYPDGGSVWCSPTSLSMVMAYWKAQDGEALPAEESYVRANVAGVYDAEYKGHGNWSFNAAWAGEQGFAASVRRFTGLVELEPWIAAGVPVIMSVSWDFEAARPLPGAPIRSSRGHLTTLVGFDAAGDPVMNEPASPDDASVRRTYPRAALEARWLEASGGTAYIVTPR